MQKKQIIKSAEDVKQLFPQLYGETNTKQLARYDNLIATFYESVGKYGYMASSSGRVEIIGNHTDHNGGKALACAISLDTIAVFLPTDDGTITIKSEGYPDVIVHINEKKTYKKGSSDALVKGICDSYKARGYNVGGFIACTTSNVSGGAGVSSSAAFENLVAEILAFLYNEDKIPAKERALVSQYAEKHYFGKPCGLLDQSAIAFGGVTLLDFGSVGDVEVKRIDNTLDDYTLILIETGGDHKNLTGEYASITEEMKDVAMFFDKSYLNEVKENEFYANLAELKKRVSGRALQRAIHFFNENKRVEAAAEALGKKDYAKFLSCVSASGVSSQNLLQNCYVQGDKEQPIPTALAISAKYLDGGANRVHGGGFAGTILNIVDNDNAVKFVSELSPIYGESKVIPLKVRKEGTIIL